ncbi:CarD family transcriptional regulator [Paraclostridium bifermentans]|uniref:CarD family transcriptional regulator n=1 Tax=Paraclostridium bifermentans TaxID=1490 RepID=UPI00189E26D8|nr:CarD family transcriptional regulator [Paraclostridium bifermentans]
MFKVDDYIMYGRTGVCKVVDITNEKFINGEERKYYVLSPIHNNNNTIIKIPLDNTKVPMRKIISKEDVTSLINDMSNMEELWIDDEKKRSNEFKTMLKSGKCEDLIKLISNKRHSKKLNKADKEIIKEAERLVNEEFAIILNISPKEVNSYISSKRA